MLHTPISSSRFSLQNGNVLPSMKVFQTTCPIIHGKAEIIGESAHTIMFAVRDW